MDYEIAAIDIDGTLLDSRGELPSQNADAIRFAVGKGVKVILVTGRRYALARQIGRKLGLSLPMIVHNGALIKSIQDAHTLARWPLPPRLALKILSTTTAFLQYMVLHRDTPPNGQTVIHPLSLNNLPLQQYLEKVPDSTCRTESLEDAIDNQLIQIMFGGELSVILQIEDHLINSGLLSEVKLAKTYYPDRNLGIIDILERQCSKRRALEFLTKHYGCHPEQVFAIGDNYNDLEMLEFAGLGVVVSNCVDHLKERGFVVTASNDEFGVARAVEKFILQNDMNSAR